MCSSEDSDSTTSDIVTSALADASGTSYVRGRWISEKENSLEIHHCIVEPTLPAMGDYSAYSLWGNFVIIPMINGITHKYKYVSLVAANKDGVPGGNKENAMHNPAYNISAALTYATQLVNVLAYYVNVKLPYKVTCGYVLLKELYKLLTYIYIFFHLCEHSLVLNTFLSRYQFFIRHTQT